MGKVNETDLDWNTVERDGAAWRRKQLAGAAGGEQLACSLYELPPGRRAWPYHYHTANEEALFVLDGRGSIRVSGETKPLEPGDYVAFPADKRGAHRVVNDSDERLRYLIVSTMNEPDVTVYPDSEKFGVYVGGAPGNDEDRTLEGYYRIGDDVDYWAGEE